MDQLAKMKALVGKGCAVLLGVLAAVVVLGTGDAKAWSPKSKEANSPGQQIAMLGEPVRDSDLKKNRGTGLDSSAPEAPVQPSGGLAVILWDEPGQGKTGGGAAGGTGNVSVTVSVTGR